MGAVVGRGGGRVLFFPVGMLLSLGKFIEEAVLLVSV